MAACPGYTVVGGGDSVAAVEKNGLNWRSFQNQPEGAPRSISEVWSVRGWPTVVVMDAQRRIHYRGHDGEAATEVARKLVAAMQK